MDSEALHVHPGLPSRFATRLVGVLLAMLPVVAAAGCAADPAAASTQLVVRATAPEVPTTSSRPAVTVPPLSVPTIESAAGAVPEPTSDTPPPPAASTAPAADPVPADPPAVSEPVPAPPDPAVVPAAPAGPLPPELVDPYRQVLGNLGSEKVVYLTFDDGPGPQTPAVLDVLAAKGVMATFCQVGSRVSVYPDAERRVIAAGHTLCNHSWDHTLHLGAAAAPDIDAQISRTQDALASFGGVAHYFRAPGGDFGTAPTLRQVCQGRSVVPLGWAVDSEDWRKPGVETVVSNVLTRVTPGAVVLMHDAGGADRDQTVAALPQIIDGLRAAGYELRPLPPLPPQGL